MVCVLERENERKREGEFGMKSPFHILTMEEKFPNSCRHLHCNIMHCMVPAFVAHDKYTYIFLKSAHCCYCCCFMSFGCRCFACCFNLFSFLSLFLLFLIGNHRCQFRLKWLNNSIFISLSLSLSLHLSLSLFPRLKIFFYFNHNDVGW